MTTQTLALPWSVPPLTKNQARRLHYRVEAKVRAQALSEARWAIKAAKLTPVWDAEFVLHYRVSNNRRQDCDGLAPTLSIVLDALVHEGILTDDSWREVAFVGERMHPPVKGLGGCMWAKLTTVEADDAA